MNNNLYIDIEVIPNLTDEQITEIETNIKPPATYKKQEAIDKWLFENGKKELEKRIQKACFNELTGQIICIGWATEDDSGVIVGDEKYIINEFTALISRFETDNNLRPPTLVGHNLIAFDLPYIWRRAKVHGIDTRILPAPVELKPWGDIVADTMVMWAGAKGKVSLDNLARGLGLKSHKDEINGSMVWPLWQAGEREKIYEYCLDDVLLTKAVYERLA